MLTITPSAASLLVNQRAESGAPESFGVRLSSPEPEEGGGASLMISFVAGPSPGDQVTEQAGLRAFVAAELSGGLEGATLDATPTNGTPPELVLRQ